MNPLYVDSQRVGVGVEKHSLYLKDLKANRIIEQFEPRNIPYDSILIQRPNGFVSFGALRWLEAHNVSLAILNWRGNVLSQFLPKEPISNELKLAQYRAFEDREKHLFIAKTFVQSKIKRQREFLKSLSDSYDIEIPRIEKINSTSPDFMRNQEARYATNYFNQFGKVCKEIGYEFRGRNQTKSNMHAPDLPNALLNYSYALLQTYVKRAINSIGLDNSIPFLHDLRRNTGLVYDLMELWRTNCDYSVLESLRILKRQKKTHYLTDGYEVMLKQQTVRTLFDNFKMNLSLEEIIFNARILANFMLGKRDLSFSLKPISVKALFENEEMKSKLMTRSYKELGMNKSTLWYQKKRLEQTGSIRIYNKTKYHFSSDRD